MSRREPAASPFRDLSNLRTPRPNPNAVPPSPQFFTASKSPLQAPTATPLRRRRPGNGAPTPTPLGRRLRALEVDQSRSARRAESGRERALRDFAASASSWLSLLLRDPSACGCSPAVSDCATAAQPCAAGKRGALDVDGERARGGRSSKRRRGGGDCGGERRKEMTTEMVTALRESLREACSLEDVTERMENYMGKGACGEVLLMMFQICKNIDEGRLKMKAQCPLVTDLRLKEKATKIFMSYNPHWLRIGLHIVLGGDSLLQTGQGKRDKEVNFLKLILEKHMFSQIVTAKSSGHKKVVEEPHVQGYSEVLGNILLKRIFLLVVALDKAKIESALPIEAGIDGLDGGSPLLFCHQSQIKSSRQIIQESLRETMHGEGDILIHLTTMGYKLNYQQPALSEYDFTMRSLFEDLQDGIILCRAVQLLLADATIISKVIAPSDTNKKRLSNCTTAIQYIKQAQTPLSDFDGVTISAEDIAAGDKELILSLLWNMFIHMQLPLLASRTSLARQLTRLNVHVTEQQMSENKPHMGLLFNWVQSICSKYGVIVENLSQFDRRALNCLINYYLNIDISPIEEPLIECRKELFTRHQLDTITDISGRPSSKTGKVLSDVLQEVDIPASHILIDGVFDENSTILFLAFLYSHLTNDERLDRLKNLINMRLDNKCAEIKISATRRFRGKIDTKYHPSQTDKKDSGRTNQDFDSKLVSADDMECNRRFLNNRNKIIAAIKIQSHWRCYSVRKDFTKQVHAIVRIQTSIRVFVCHQALQRHRLAAVLIQRVVRGWFARKRLLGSSLRTYRRLCVVDQTQKGKIYQSLQLKIVLDSIIRLQRSWRKFLLHQSVKASVISIQSFVRGWLTRKHLNQTLCCINIIQRWWRKILESRKEAAIVIQTHFRGWVARQNAIKTRSSIINIQRWWRKILESRRKAAIVIQTCFRGWFARQNAIKTISSIINIQRWWRKILESRKKAAVIIQTRFRGWIARQDAVRTKNSINNIQRWWRKLLFIKLRKQAVLVIQAHFRGWIARQVALRTRKSITTIQSYAKAYLVRKTSKEEVACIRSRLLVSALLKLRHCRSIHNIRQTCATLSSATEYSKKCCETLVAAGAIDILLKQIHLLNRGIADQEVLKQVFLTLRNIARYANLRHVLASTPEFVETVFQELLRNKADGFFIASDILKSLCESKEGHETIQALSHHIKRLRNLVQDLEKKVELDKRNGRTGAMKTNNLRRLRKAATLYHVLTSCT